MRYRNLALALPVLIGSICLGCQNDNAPAPVTDSPGQNQALKPAKPGLADLEREHRARLVEAEQRAKEEEDRKKGLIFVEAKRVLLNSLDSVGGMPEANVRKGIELLTEYLARPDAPNQEEAGLLLEHAQLAVSDERVLQFVELIGDYHRRTGDKFVMVNASHLDALCRGFSGRFTVRVQGRGGGEPSIFVCSKFYIAGGDSCNSIETAFYDTVAKNAKQAIQQIAARKEKDRREREQRVVLQNGTDDFKRIVQYPEKYECGHFYFDGFFGSPFGSMKRDKKAACYTVAFRCQHKQILPAHFGLKEDDINFVVSEEMGNKLLDLQEDTAFLARVYCRTAVRCNRLVRRYHINCTARGRLLSGTRPGRPNRGERDSGT